MEQMRQEEARQKAELEKRELAQKQEEYNRLENLRRQEERRIMERQQMEALIKKESKVVHGQVTRRDDDPFGQGFGYVKTGFVSSQKLSFLQRSSSVDRSDPRMFLGGADSAQSNDSRGRGLRVTWAESPNSSRPGSNLGWADKV